jgi:hypothetical protein
VGVAHDARVFLGTEGIGDAEHRTKGEPYRRLTYYHSARRGAGERARAEEDDTPPGRAGWAARRTGGDLRRKEKVESLPANAQVL